MLKCLVLRVITVKRMIMMMIHTMIMCNCPSFIHAHSEDFMQSYRHLLEIKEMPWKDLLNHICYCIFQSLLLLGPLCASISSWLPLLFIDLALNVFQMSTLHHIPAINFALIISSIPSRGHECL